MDENTWNVLWDSDLGPAWIMGIRNTWAEESGWDADWQPGQDGQTSDISAWGDYHAEACQRMRSACLAEYGCQYIGPDGVGAKCEPIDPPLTPPPKCNEMIKDRSCPVDASVCFCSTDPVQSTTDITSGTLAGTHHTVIINAAESEIVDLAVQDWVGDMHNYCTDHYGGGVPLIGSHSCACCRSSPDNLSEEQCVHAGFCSIKDYCGIQCNAEQVGTGNNNDSDHTCSTDAIKTCYETCSNYLCI